MNPAQLLLNQMMNSPQVQNNPMAKNAMQMYQSGDTGGLKTSHVLPDAYKINGRSRTRAGS